MQEYWGPYCCSGSDVVRKDVSDKKAVGKTGGAQNLAKCEISTNYVSVEIIYGKK